MQLKVNKVKINKNNNNEKRKFSAKTCYLTSVTKER